MQRLVGLGLVAAIATQAQMMVLKGVDTSTITTGDLLEGTGSLGITTNVAEIGGLMVSARSGDANQQLNANDSYFGVNTDGSGDVADAFEAGERMVLSFNRNIQINRIDFNRLQDGETFTVVVDGMPGIVVAYNDLANKQSGFFDTNLVVDAGTEIEFYTTDASVVGLDGIDISVLDAVPLLSLIYSNGTTSVSVSFNGVAGTNYVLQYRAGLSDPNGWATISAPFSSNTDWGIETTNSAGFYRAIVQ